MIQFIHQYPTVLETSSGQRYVARVYADEIRGGAKWEAWFVFFPLLGGDALPTDRETTQSKLEDVSYWASGITATYLEGALKRALDRRPEVQLARRAALAEREELYARLEADTYQRAASEALRNASEAEERRTEALNELSEIKRVP
jgi:hypothetical protein